MRARGAPGLGGAVRVLAFQGGRNGERLHRHAVLEPEVGHGVENGIREIQVVESGFPFGRRNDILVRRPWGRGFPRRLAPVVAGPGWRAAVRPGGRLRSGRALWPFSHVRRLFGVMRGGFDRGRPGLRARGRLRRRLRAAHLRELPLDALNESLNHRRTIRYAISRVGSMRFDMRFDFAKPAAPTSL